MDELGKTNLTLPISTSFTVFPDRYFLFNPQLLETEKKETQMGYEEDLKARF